MPQSPSTLVSGLDATSRVPAFTKQFDDHFDTFSHLMQDALKGKGSSPEATERCSNFPNWQKEPQYWGWNVRFIKLLWEYVKEDFIGYVQSHELDSDHNHVCIVEPCSWDHPGIERIPRSKANGICKCMRPNMHGIVQRYVKPWTHSVPVGLALLLNAGHVTRRVGRKPKECCEASIFISHCWNENFEDFVSTIVKAVSLDVPVWVCSFAIDQHADVAASLASLEKCPFAVAMKSSDRVLAITDSDAEAFRRCWCVLEAVFAKTWKKTYDVSLPNDASTELWAEVDAKIQKLDLEDCEATMKKDKDAILAYARANGGLQAVNEKVHSVAGKAAQRATLMAAAAQGDLSLLDQDRTSCEDLYKWRSIRGRTATHVSARNSQVSFMVRFLEIISTVDESSLCLPHDTSDPVLAFRGSASSHFLPSSRRPFSPDSTLVDDSSFRVPHDDSAPVLVSPVAPLSSPVRPSSRRPFSPDSTLALCGLVIAKQKDGHAEVVLKDEHGKNVAKVPNGEIVSIIQNGTDAVKVRWNNDEGWAKAVNLEALRGLVVAKQKDGHAEVVLKDEHGKNVARVPNGEVLSILQTGTDAVKVRWNNVEGWAKATNLEAPKEEKPADAMQPMEIAEPTEEVVVQDETPEAAPAMVPASERTGTVQNKDQHPDVILWSLDGKRQIKMPNGDRVTIIEEIDNQYKVRWKDQVGLVKQWHIQAFSGSVSANGRGSHAEFQVKDEQGQVVETVPDGDLSAIVPTGAGTVEVRWNSESCAEAGQLEATAFDEAVMIQFGPRVLDEVTPHSNADCPSEMTAADEAVMIQFGPRVLDEVTPHSNADCPLEMTAADEAVMIQFGPRVLDEASAPPVDDSPSGGVGAIPGGDCAGEEEEASVDDDDEARWERAMPEEFREVQRLAAISMQDGEYRWEVRLDHGWEPWTPHVPFVGTAGEEIRYTLGGQRYRATFSSDDAGTQRNLDTDKRRALRKRKLARARAEPGTCIIAWPDVVAAKDGADRPLQQVVPFTDLRPPFGAFCIRVGLRVDARRDPRFRGRPSQPQWFRAIVERVNPDGTFMVRWEDGDERDRQKQAHELRPRTDRSANLAMTSTARFSPEALDFFAGLADPSPFLFMQPDFYFGRPGAPSSMTDLNQELIKELKRGARCSKSMVLRLIEEHADLLMYEGKEGVLSLALRHRCPPSTIEVLLLAQAPLVNRSCSTTTTAQSAQDVEAQAQTLGVVVYNQPVPVTESWDRRSTEVARIAQGESVAILEIADRPNDGRVRARIASPPGWISIRMEDDSFDFVQVRSPPAPAPAPATSPGLASAAVPAQATSPAVPLVFDGTRLADLKKMARAMGVEREDIDAADDTESPKETVIELILAVQAERGDEERRIDPMLDNRAVTYEEMRRAHSQEELVEEALRAHWGNLQPAQVELQANSTQPSEGHERPPDHSGGAAAASVMVVGNCDAVVEALALKEPRISVLVADRGVRWARAATDSLTSLTAPNSAAANSESPGQIENVDNALVANPIQEKPERAPKVSAEQRLETSRECINVTTRLADPRAKGTLDSLLHSFTADLLGPLVNLSDRSALEPNSWLGTILKAMSAAGCTMTSQHINNLAAAIVARLAEEPAEELLGVLNFLEYLLKLNTCKEEAQTNKQRLIDPSILASAFHRHGVVACLERLAASGIANSVPYPVSPAGTVSSLRDSANRVFKQLVSLEDKPQDIATTHQSEDSLLRDVLTSLSDTNSLQKLVGLIKEGACTPFELGLAGAPETILPLLEPSGANWPWAGHAVASPDPETASSLASALQVLLSICETFPVCGSEWQSGGMDCLVRPLELALRGHADKRVMIVEPLLPLTDLAQFVLQTTPIENQEYVTWCNGIVGKRIAERPLGRESKPWRGAVVVAFSVECRLPVHTVSYEDDGVELRLLLHLRQVVMLGEKVESSSSKTEAEETVPAPPPSFLVGTKVMARFKKEGWYRAAIDSDNGDGTYTVNWDNGTRTDRIKKLEALQLRAPRDMNTVCRTVQVKPHGCVSSMITAIAVGQHESGALDVVDQEGRYLLGVPGDQIAPVTRNSRPHRPVPVSGFHDPPVPTPLRPPPSASSIDTPVQLERSFSALDRNPDYRVNSYESRTIARRFGDRRGEALERLPEAEQATSIEEEVERGTSVPRLRVVFFRDTQGDESERSPVSEASPVASATPSPALRADSAPQLLPAEPDDAGEEDSQSDDEMDDRSSEPGATPSSPQPDSRDVGRSLSMPNTTIQFSDPPAQQEAPSASATETANTPVDTPTEQATTIADDPKLLDELKKMNLKSLKLRALEIGCRKIEVESVDDTEDAEQSVIELILRKASSQSEGTAQPLPLSSTSTVLQALLHDTSSGQSLREPGLRFEIHMDRPDVDCAPPALPLCRTKTGVSRASDAGAAGKSATVLALLRRLRRLASCSGESKESVACCWENGPLNRKLADQLARPLIATGGVAPDWVEALPLAYPFLFNLKLREQLLHCTGFGTSHAVLWLQRQAVEKHYGRRLRQLQGNQDENSARLADLEDKIIHDKNVFIGPARADLASLPSRKHLLANAERIVERTYSSKALLEVKFLDEGFGDGVTQSFYTDVAKELSAADGENATSGVVLLWASHDLQSRLVYQDRQYLHSARGLFPQPHPPDSEESKEACRRMLFLGRLMAKALRDGFIVPLRLNNDFFAAVLNQDLPLSALPQPEDGWDGGIVGALAHFAVDLRGRVAKAETMEAKTAVRQEAASEPGWVEKWKKDTGPSKDMSFNECMEVGVYFLSMGNNGVELCDGGGNRAVTIDNLEDFVVAAARWWLCDGIAAQVSAFRQGVADVCTSSAIWAFSASELRVLFCGSDSVEWTAEELRQGLRPRDSYARLSNGKYSPPVEMLIAELVNMPPERRGQFLEFVTACPRLPPGGLAAADISILPAAPRPGVDRCQQLPTSRTCTKELHLPEYESPEQLSAKLAEALGGAKGLFDGQ